MVFSDVFSPDFLTAPRVNIFMSGFPCQPWSTAGNGKGLQHLSGTIVFRILAYIVQRRPTTFILENVAGLMKQHAALLQIILQVLDALVDHAGRKMHLVIASVLSYITSQGLGVGQGSTHTVMDYCKPLEVQHAWGHPSASYFFLNAF